MASIAATPPSRHRHATLSDLDTPVIDILPAAALDGPGLVAQVRAWMARENVEARGCVLLMPFAQQLGSARAAWAQAGGWMPEIETTQTLAQRLGPPPGAQEGQISFDVHLDRLAAARILRSQARLQAWGRTDPRAFDDAVAGFVRLSHGLARAAAAIEPSGREAHWRQARALLAAGDGPGLTERQIAAIALEWAAAAAPPHTDALFALRPAAWIAVRVGGSDPLTDALLRAASVPAVVIDTDAAALRLPSRTPAVALCEGFEDEAQCTAAQVLAHVQRGELPVALVAQDRLLVRRVHALLARQSVAVLDETGWKLSTTRAAAQLMGLLRAVGASSADATLDALKSLTAPWPGLGLVASLTQSLEATCRRHGWRRTSQIDPERLHPGEARLWAALSASLAPLAEPGRRPLREWCAALQGLLGAAGLADALADDAAGAQVLAALWLSEGRGWPAQAGQTSMTLEQFRQWVDGVLEESSFVPPAPPQPAVVITPLAHATLRPFAALVLPGADERHLGAGVDPLPFISDAQAVALGLPSAASRREREALSFAHAMHAAQVTLLRRHVDGSEPLSASPLVERLSLALQKASRAFEAWADPRPSQAVEPQPVFMPAPSAAALLPDRLSASACEALRACPYRFHALHMLKLREPGELDEEVEKRDYGNWLHAVLQAFHETRTAPGTPADETARLLHLGRTMQDRAGLADEDFLPYGASFEQLAPRYVAWLHERDAQGIAWAEGEQAHEIDLPAPAAVTLHGRIDRADRRRDAGTEVLELIDYKTGSETALRQQVRQPLEDTQLAFYAALMRPHTDASLQAVYLLLDAGHEIRQVPHPEVEASAQALVEGLSDELARIRAGAGLPALGEGRVCDFCEARGLCRKDQWSAR
jgi:ATP-dependent helicase/nuclease subunit B